MSCRKSSSSSASLTAKGIAFVKPAQVAIHVVLLLSLIGLRPCAAQVQIMPSEKVEMLRQSLPEATAKVWQTVFRDPTTMFYTDQEIPPAYQHSDVETRNGQGGRTSFHWTGYNISAGATESAKGDGNGGNASVEFPWRFPGGTDFAHETIESFKLMWLPKREDGRPWPVAFREETLLGALTGSHQGYAWTFPVGTVFGEVLAMKDSTGALHTFEVRLRKRERHYWDVDILRPFPMARDLARRLTELDAKRYAPQILQLTASVVLPKSTLTDSDHPTEHGFMATAAEDVLPTLGEKLAIELLDSTPFHSALGAVWREGSKGTRAFAPTSEEPFSVVPFKYAGTFLGTDTNSCAKCHDSTSRHADEFDAGRDWYGYVRGSDRIFTFHPIDPSAVSRNGAPGPVRLRREFVEGGVVESFDAGQHPPQLYSPLSR